MSNETKTQVHKTSWEEKKKKHTLIWYAVMHQYKLIETETEIRELSEREREKEGDWDRKQEVNRRLNVNKALATSKSYTQMESGYVFQRRFEWF